MCNMLPEGLSVPLKVIPNSQRNQVIGWENEELKIKINAQPEDGKANKELIAYLSKLLKIAKSDIILLSGEGSRHKKILIKGLDKETFISRLKLDFD